MKVMFHDDDCGELLDSAGKCPTCGFHPDMQSTGFRDVAELPSGRSFLGPGRAEIGEGAKMRRPSAQQVAQAKKEIELEDAAAALLVAPVSNRSSLPSEDPNHVCGLLCDGQDGANSYCARLRRKLFG